MAKPPIQEQQTFVRRKSSRERSQLPWPLSRQVYASTTAHTPPRQPEQYHSKKPFKSKVVTSDQTDSGKTPQKEKAAFLHFDVLRKRSKLRGEKQFTSTPTKELPLFLPRAPDMERGSDPNDRSLSPKNRATRN